MGDITATGGNANTDIAFKNCAPFTKCIRHIKIYEQKIYEHIDTAEKH